MLLHVSRAADISIAGQSSNHLPAMEMSFLS
jgi:hypothetical protein